MRVGDVFDQSVRLDDFAAFHGEVMLDSAEAEFFAELLHCGAGCIVWIRQGAERIHIEARSVSGAAGTGRGRSRESDR